MNTDIRLSTGFWQHPKTKKTVKRLGLEGIRSLQILWLWAAQNRPDGNLFGMDWEDIELTADWNGEEKAFFDFCLNAWIDQTPQGLVLHDWQEHNPWQADAELRQDEARLHALKRWNPKVAKQLEAAGIKGISKAQYADLKDAPCLPHGYPLGPHKGSQRPPNGSSNAPDPYPDPEEFKILTHDRSENIDRARDPGPEQGGDSANFDNSPQFMENKAKIAKNDNLAISDFSDEPGLEFQELRDLYDKNAKPEGPLAGFIEYKQLRASRKWPGQSVIFSDILKRGEQEPQWREGYATGLARYLSSRGWEAPMPKPRDGPPGSARGKPDAAAIIDKNAEISRKIMEEYHGSP